MARTISTAITGPVALAAADTPLTITASGSVTSAAGDGVSAGSGVAWQIVNNGAISATAASAAGFYFAGSGWSLLNGGRIQGGTAGVYASGGGAVTNNVGGLISGSNYGVYIAGGAAVVTNAGTISSSWLAVNFAFTSASNRLVAAPGAVFNGLVRGGGGTLELAAPSTGTPSAGSIAGVSTTASGSFQSFQTIAVDAGATWTLTGANTITNILDNGALVTTGALPAANIQLGAAGGSGALEVASASGSRSPISFLGAGTLKIDNYASFGTSVGTAGYAGPLLTNFGADDKIDILNLSATGATFSYNSTTGLLQITSGAQVASLAFQNSTLSGTFGLASDGGTGVYVTTMTSAAAVTEALAADTGSSSTDRITFNPALTGTAAANTTVTLTEGVTALGTAPVNASGVWAFTPTGLSQGAHTIVATDAGASASLTFTYDSVAPAVTEALVNGALTGSGDPNALAALIEGSVTLGTTTANADGSWAYALPALAAGAHTVVASETDAAGNTGSTTLTFTAASGEVTEALAADTGSSSTDRITFNPALTGTAAANTTVTLTEGVTALGTAPVNASGVWAFTPTGLSQGAHTIVATDAGASASLTFTYDSVAPAVTEALVNGALTGSGDPNALAALIEGGVTLGTTTANADGSWAYALPALAAGAHTVVASETDAAGNTGSTTLTFTAASGEVTEALAADTGSSSTDRITFNPALTGTAAANTTVTLTEGVTALGTAPVNASGVWAFTPTGLSQGAHTIVATDAGASASLTFTYDSVAPAVTEALVNGALTGSGDPNALATLIEGGVTLGTTTANADGSWTYALPALAAGAHTVVASETDAAGNTGSTTLTFTAASGEVTEALAADTGSSSTDRITFNPALTGTAAANTTVTLTEGVTALGTAPVNASGVWAFTPTGLSQGAHTIVATDAGASASLTFTYDSVAPAVTEALVNGALTGSGDPNALATLIEGGVTLGTTTANADGSWTYALPALAAGAHTVVASETDAAGNTGSTTLTFTAASGEVTEALAADTGSSSTDKITFNPALTGTAAANTTVTLTEGVTALGTAPVNASGVWAFTPTGLSQGAHTIVATDAGASASLTFTYDSTKPIPVFTTTPPATGATSSAAFAFNTSNADTGVVYGYELDGSTTWASGAGATLTLSGLTNGAHTLLLQATDAAGNVSATPASYSWTIGSGGRTISTAITGPVALAAADTPLTITASGSVTSAAGDGVSAGSGVAWQIVNNGAISATAASAAGFYFAGSGWSLLNGGRIQGGTAGVYASGGGAVTNNVGGLISGSNYGVYIAGGAAVVTNAGTISSSWLAVNFAFTSASNRLVAAPGAVFNGLVRGGGGTLELAAPSTGTPSAGSIAGVSTTASGSFQSFQTIAVDAGATWTLTGANTITNILDNGALVTTGALPAANIQLGAAGGSGALEVASASGSRSPISFLGAGTLKIDNYASFGTSVGTAGYAGPLLTNFGADDKIDILNLSATGATFSYNSTTGLLQITSGAQVASLAFQNSTLSGTFGLASDGGTGVYVTTMTSAAAVTEALAADTGSSSTDRITFNPALTGTAAANTTVTLTEGVTALGTAPVNASGVWAFTPTGLSQGAHTIVATDAGASASLTFTYDSVAPAVTEALVNGALTGSGDPNALAALIEGGVTLGTTTANADGSWAYALPALAAGAHTVVASETDAAGNTGSTTLTFTAPPAVPKYNHIVVVVEENKNYDEIIGNTNQAPYLSSLASGGALLTDFVATTHPSQPNYFDLYAGSTFGVADDGAYQLSGPTLYDVLHNAGLTFTGYVDAPGGSDFNHDPWVSFPEGRTVQTDITTFPALFPSGDYSSLPTVSFVIPGVNNDMHNGTIPQGDSWLAANLSSYAQWAQANNSLLVVVWDESDDESSTVSADPNNIVPAIFYGANVVPGQYGSNYGFENLLSTITASYGLTAPNNAALAAPITGIFANTPHT